MFQDSLNFILGLTAHLGYWGVGLLMTIESSFLPFPSEIVVPPAAYLASQGEMNVFLVVIFGVLGSILGAVINYFLALYFGRFLVYKLAATRLAKLIFITPEKLEKAEKYFLANSNSATFFGRLIPVIRQLVSMPAGFSKMNFGRFVLLTALGSAIWVSILAALGYFLGANQELLHRYYEELKWVFLALAIIYIFFKFNLNRFLVKKRG
ncbi:DedA family protein [Candidatus Falkowbacteria bacterium]|nr:DedA family protein [Candidatus Falkowbacteria bacterium]NCT55089.1 DedA family protein [Candidatus Falkowbacteria bacterium]